MLPFAEPKSCTNKNGFDGFRVRFDHPVDQLIRPCTSLRFTVQQTCQLQEDCRFHVTMINRLLIQLSRHVQLVLQFRADTQLVFQFCAIGGGRKQSLDVRLRLAESLQSDRNIDQAIADFIPAFVLKQHLFECQKRPQKIIA